MSPELARQAANAIRRAYGGPGSSAPPELPQWKALYALDEIARQHKPCRCEECKNGDTS